mgnify:FL=1
MELYKFSKGITFIVGTLMFIVIGIPILRLIYFALRIFHDEIVNYIKKTKLFLTRFSYFYYNEHSQKVHEKESIIVFEAKVNEITNYGNCEFVRYGTYHFFPNEIVYLSCEQQNKSVSTRVVGLHRTGLIKSCQIRDTDLSYVKIKIIKFTTYKLIKMVKEYKILKIYKSKNTRNILLRLLVNNKQYGTHLFNRMPNDNEINRAMEVLNLLKSFLLNGDIVSIKKNFIKFPIKVYNANDKLMKREVKIHNREFELLNETTFERIIPRILSQKVIGAILSINPAFLCPKNHCMFIGIFKINFSNSKSQIQSIDLSPSFWEHEFNIHNLK